MLIRVLSRLATKEIFTSGFSVDHTGIDITLLGVTVAVPGGANQTTAVWQSHAMAIHAD